MKIIHTLNDLVLIEKPVSLTIGNFDGVHLGHQLLLNHLTKAAKAKSGSSLVITFIEHPKTVLHELEHPSICTLAHKCKLLEEAQVDFLLLLPFTKKFAEQTADIFLENIYAKYPFSHLIFGEDALFGKDRHATKEHVTAVAKKFNFTVEYLKLLEIKGKKVSSSSIRALIQQGAFLELKNFLGRNYSIYNKVIAGHGKGKTLGFATANLDVSGLVLPPLGVFSMRAHFDDKIEKAIANLGIAPTIRNESKPRLEIHLLNSQENVYGKYIDAVFEKFIRKEKRFSSVEELQSQIQKDIHSTF